MKKIITTTAALVLSLAMSATTFASQSVTIPSNQTTTTNTSTTTNTPTTSGTTTSTPTTSGKGSVTQVKNYAVVSATATDANGNAVSLNIKSLTAAQTAEAEAEVSTVFGADADVFAAGDYNVDGASESNPITVTFDTPGVNAGDKVWVLHKRHDGNWYKESATAANGKVTAVFTSFSPMVVVREEAAVATTSGVHYHSYADTVVAPTETTWGYTMHTCACGDNYTDSYVAPLGGAAAATTSPKTADNGAFGFVLAAFACGAALICVSRKKTA